MLYRIFAFFCFLRLAALTPVDAQVLTPSNTDFVKSQSAFWQVGKPYQIQFSSTPGCNPIQYSGTGQASGFSAMPSNFSWNASGSQGTLSGTFSAAGSYQFNLTLRCGSTALSSDYQLYVNDALTLVRGPYPGTCHAGVLCGVPLNSGGSPDFTAKVTSGALPNGCSLASDSLTTRRAYGITPAVSDPHRYVYVACTPYSAQGTSNFSVSVTDGFSTTATADYTMVIGPPPVFYASNNALFFAATADGNAQTRTLTAGTDDHSKTTFHVTSDASWLNASPTSGTTPASLTVTMDPSKLAAGTYQGRLTLAPQGSKAPVTVNVTASIAAPSATPVAAALGVAPESAEVELWAILDGNKRYELGFHAWNDGSTALDVEVSAFSVLKWLSCSTTRVTIAPAQTQALAVIVDASSLQPGTYFGSIQLKAGTLVKTIPVSVTVPKLQLTPNIRVTQNDNWHCIMGSQDVLSRHTFLVYNDVYPTALDFTASISGATNPFTLTSSSGHIAPKASVSEIAPYPVCIAIPWNTYSNLTPGRYEALLTLTAPGAAGSPVQAKLQETFVESISNHGTGLHEDSFIVRTENPVVVQHSHGEKVTATLKIENPSNVPVSFVVSSLPEVVFDITSAFVGAKSRVVVTANVNLDPSSLTWPKILMEMESAAGANVYEIQPGMVAAPPQPGSPAAGLHPLAATSCTPTRLVLGVATPPVHFHAPADTPQSIEVAVYDDCGIAVTDAVVTASFTSGDAGISLPVSDASTGTYSGLWTPTAASEDMAINLRAMKGTLTAATQRIAGAVIEDATAPVIFSGGVVSNVNPVLSAPSSPGAVVSIYGKRLAAAAAQPASAQLPTELGGTRVLIGGVAAPLFYVSPGQINALIPSELTADAAYSVSVLTQDRVATPKSVRLAKLSPGIAAYADGRVIAQHGDYSLVTGSAPAKPNEYIVFYLVGMGPTTPAVPTGTLSPFSPLAYAVSQPTVTIGGLPATVAFAGLTPGGVGLYQINVQVPATAPNGDLALVVTQDNVTANSVALPVAR